MRRRSDDLLLVSSVAFQSLLVRLGIIALGYRLEAGVMVKLIKRLREAEDCPCAFCGHTKCWYARGGQFLCQRCALEDKGHGFSVHKSFAEVKNAGIQNQRRGS